MAKITMKSLENRSIAETIEKFIIQRKVLGVSDKTAMSYHGQFKSLSRHLDLSMPIADLNKQHLDQMIISLCNQARPISPNTIATYVRIFRVFLGWCRDEGLTTVTLQKYKEVETVKETYTDDELEALLKKPNMNKCKFTEYRDWAIINLLVNNGCRASSIRNIQIKDVDLSGKMITLRHNKSRRVQVLPLSTAMVAVLKEYMKIRGGEQTDCLFPNEAGAQMTENGLRCTIKKYNERRGVEKTSIHAFHHTFARKYLVDCGGNAFMLQKLLGHSTLDMTKHYCQIYNSDIVAGFDEISPLAQFQKKTKNKIKMN